MQRCREIWEHLHHGEVQVFSKINIPHSHVLRESQKSQIGNTFQANKHYFLIRINEMRLLYDRTWWNTYMPMVFVVTEFTYDKGEKVIPFIVGTKMMDQFGQNMPLNMTFSDTQVANIHPYRGGPLKLTVILYQVRREDYARNLLQVVERITNILNILPLSSYGKVANVALDGLESILGMQDTKPLLGLHREFDSDAGDRFESGYFALIDQPDAWLRPEMFWVSDHQLFYGENAGEAKPYSKANFVLYSILQATERSDSSLPFYPLYEEVIKSASSPFPADWERTKANMVALAGAMYLSPDLIPDQAQSLVEKYKSEMVYTHKGAQAILTLGPARPRSPLDIKLDETIEILKM